MTNRVSMSIVIALLLAAGAARSCEDIVADEPAAAPEAGHPIGNGRMGTMVWTSPEAIHFQVNRVDVFAVDREHQGLPEYRGGRGDICGGIAGVVVAVGGRPFAPGAAPFRRRLSLEHAECTIEAADLQVRCFVAADTDVLVVDVDDRRPSPGRLGLTISMLRPPQVRAGEHVAESTFGTEEDRIVLTQRFQERHHHNASAVAVMADGAAATVEATSATSRTLVLPPAAGRRTILIASAATWNREVDVSAAATVLMRAAGTARVDELRAGHRAWWSDFWSRTFVRLRSADGQAERCRTLHLYHMASSSRGELPPKWNGSLFGTTGDRRGWGSQYWVWTTEMLFMPLLAADAIDLTDPLLQHVSATAARLRAGGAAAVGGRRRLLSRDGGVQRPGRASGRRRRRGAGCHAGAEAPHGDVGASPGILPIRRASERRRRAAFGTVQLDQPYGLVGQRGRGPGLVAIPAHRRPGMAADARPSAAPRHGRVLPPPRPAGYGWPLASCRHERARGLLGCRGRPRFARRSPSLAPGGAATCPRSSTATVPRSPLCRTA